MPVCPYCEREFVNQAALAGHIGRKHWDQAHVEVPPLPTLSGDNQPCPVCGYKLPWTTVDDSYPLTACPRCRCIYDSSSGQPSRLPEELAAAVAGGQPCPNPMYTYYYKKYKGGEQ